MTRVLSLFRLFWKLQFGMKSMKWFRIVDWCFRDAIRVVYKPQNPPAFYPIIGLSSVYKLTSR